MPAGRPSDYSDELSDYICEELLSGRSLRQICDDPSMPDRKTVLRWLGRHEDFATKYAHARESQADLMDDKILEVADNSTPETAQSDKVKIGAYQWRASKLKPKVYGDRQTIDLNARIGDLADSELDAEIAKLTGIVSK